MATRPNILRDHLIALYGQEVGRNTLGKLLALIEKYRAQLPSRHSSPIDQSDAILITYGDQLSHPGIVPLRVLADFCNQYLRGVVSGIHILPFFPYSSDDGFSVIDYRRVDPVLGSWEDIQQVGEHFRLMFDAVINHISAQSDWFQGFLKDQPPYTEYFIVVDEEVDLSQVVRPRALPLLEKVSTPSGDKSVWTTFSSDQIDLNYANPQVLLDILEILLFYVQRGAEFIRLDAIAYLWKQIGTSCIHLPQTHQVIQVMRAVLDRVAPAVQLITETNVPHDENVSYFGDGRNEAQMVYNFGLPPLVLHTFHTADATAISRWAAGLQLPSPRVTFFNFLASHDGIGVTPARGLISDLEINDLVERTQKLGGLISYRSNPDGSQSPYELNINYLDALANPELDEPLQTQVDRFVAAHAIMFSLVGIPGIYFHSLFGSRGWQAGVSLTGRKRTINREKLEVAALVEDLNRPGSIRTRVYKELSNLLKIRSSLPALHPYGTQQVRSIDRKVFALLRSSPDGLQHVLCMQNISAQPVRVEIDRRQLPFDPAEPLYDLISGVKLPLGNIPSTTLEPYQVCWVSSP